MHIHICIVTGQPMANLIPIMQEKPEHIILLSTSSMVHDTEQFKQTLIFAGWSASAISVVPLAMERYKELYLFAIEHERLWLAQFPNATFTYNASGGTKPMAMAFFDVLKASHRVIYTDTGHNEIAVLAPPKEQSFAQQSVITMALALKAENKTLRSAESENLEWLTRATERKALTYQLAKFAAKNSSSLSFINGIAHYSLQNNLAAVKKVKAWGALKALFKSAEKLGMLTWNNSQRALTFHSEESAKYFGGFWLEEYVFLEASKIGFDEVSCGVDIADNSKRAANIRNDIDLIICHNNRLLFIECKTSRMDKEAEIIYKLDSLTTQAAGTFGAMMLVTAQSLTYTNKEGHQVFAGERAKSHKIRTCEGEQLLVINQFLESWKNKGTWR